MTSLLRFVCKVGAGFSIILLKSSVHVPSIGSLSLENSCQVAETSKPGRHSTLELVCGKKQMPRYACNASVFPQPRFELSTRVFNSTRAFFWPIATFILLDDDEAVVLSPQTNPQSCSKQCFDHHAASSALTSLVH